MTSTIRRALKELSAWSKEQELVRLVLGSPVDDADIDRLPLDIHERHGGKLPVAFNPNHFALPSSYRQFLKMHAHARIEYREDEDSAWSVYEPFNVLSPAEVAKGHSFIRGAKLEGKATYTTFLVAFATAGFGTEASRWCFYTDGDIAAKPHELPILCESNDFECDLAKYVETRQWVEHAFNKPAALSFEDWLARLVDTIVSTPFDPERLDELPKAFYKNAG